MGRHAGNFLQFSKGYCVALKTFHRIEQLLKATVTHSKYFLVKINSRVFGGVKKILWVLGTHIAERNLLHFLWNLVFKFSPKYGNLCIRSPVSIFFL